MDRIWAVLCAFGAAVLLFSFDGGPDAPLLVLALGGAFYAFHRIAGSRAALALTFAPALAWALHRFWGAMPDDLARRATGVAVLREAPGALATLVMSAAFVTSLVLARPRIGRGLAGLAIGALVLGLATKGLAALLDPAGAFAMIVGRTAAGWRSVSPLLTAASWLAFAIGPVGATPLRARTGPMVGAVGAALLAATIAGGGNASADAVFAVVLLTFVLALVLSAVGLGALARAGAGRAAWVAMALVIAQIPAIVVVVAMFDRGGRGSIVLFSTAFALLGFGIVALLADGMALGALRGVIGVLFVVALGGTWIAWMGVLGSLMRVVRHANPSWWLDHVTQPSALPALVAWSACVAYLCWPPEEPRAA